MTGRDLRTFLSAHRSGTFNTSKTEEGLSMKYIVGGAAMGGRGLKTADYSALLDKAKEQREASHHQFKKVKHISAKSGASKEAGLLRLHKGVWQDEWGRLVEERSRTESGLEEWRTLAIRDGDDMGELMRTLLEYEADLKEEGIHFERDTLMPVRRLQAHLRGCSSKEGMAEGGRRGREVSRSDVLSEISVVKRQQELVQSELREEYFTLWKDLIEFQKEHVPERKGVWLFGAPPTVPSHDVECSNDKLKGLLTEQFNKLNQHYISIFHQLRESCQSSEFGGWSQEEAERFEHILSQYPLSLYGQRRHAYLHRLAWEFPHYTREQLVQHETWFLSISHRHCIQKWEVSRRDWHTQHKALEVKVQELLRAHAHELEVKEAGLQAMEAQAALCKHLSEKVSKWREERQRKAALEAEHESALLLEEETRRVEEEEQKIKKEKLIKGRLSAYHRSQAEAKARERAWLRQLKEEADLAKREVAVSGRGRVNYRKDQLLDKLSQQNRYLEERKEEEKEKERRLDLLRKQVKVHATSDPKRLHQQTQSVQARMTFDPELPTQHPLFPLHGFLDTKVTSDPRIRLEGALRKAGLHATKYGRQVLASVQPPTAPRPDQKHSNVFNM